MPRLSAAWPDRKLTMPTLKVSCACAPPAAHKAAAAASIRSAAPWRRMLFITIRLAILLSPVSRPNRALGGLGDGRAHVEPGQREAALKIDHVLACPFGGGLGVARAQCRQRVVVRRPAARTGLRQALEDLQQRGVVEQAHRLPRPPPPPAVARRGHPPP